MRTRLLHPLVAQFACACLALAGAQAQVPQATRAKTGTSAIRNIILVHGAYADGSSYAKVIPLLRARGLRVTAVQNPLTSLANDVAATRRAIARQDGPVILVGHSSAGVVITQAGADPKVVGLVYISAIIPDAGQSALDAISGYPPTPGGAQQPKDASGYLTITHQGVIEDFVPDIPMAERELVYETQGDWYSGFLNEKVTAAAWRTKPSWVIIPDDRMVPPQHQRDAARRMQAKTTKLKSGHVPMLSQPQRVADVILDAAANASRRTVAANLSR
ncbi:alpha/beta fold hydrolase [Gemmatimonas groenlandica]|uniref:Alpha/beta hydrolase n=1 Tax=Gemmatimonas groenlandica TaxID=2732249 RepID=A0A6M4IJ38_9BACT|nr:alpha/beta hydrolase [Gemmatimonas groenlandica]QJR34065.1 alpha/beta hydrolase [Gemmatimonas groenlandica]